MALSKFTSADDIRACLGISPKELDDAVLLLDMYETGLSEELLELGDTLEADYLAIVALPQGTLTAVQQRFVNLTKLFSALSVSRTLAGSLSMFSPKKITDGKAAVERFVDAYAGMKAALLINYGTIRTKLIAAYAATGGVTATSGTVRTYMVVSAGADPVTGA